ncbi:MAG TPA: hypothetical protein VIF15_13705 [Polyangiaceae bacterium]|jgi:hypothetical protein
MRPPRLALAVGALGVLLVASESARADAIDACVSAATSGQLAQRRGQLRAARRAFLACAMPECPAEVKAVCEPLLANVESSLPTVILGARDDRGQDLADVRVSVDGAAFAETLDGKAAAMDPGPHVLRFERVGAPPVELQVVIREAEKNRAIGVVLPAGPGADRDGQPEARSPRVGPPAPFYALGGVALVSVGVFATLAIHGQRQFDGCNPHGCSQSTVDSLALERGLAFGALGVGVVSAGVAAWLFATRPASTTTPGPAPVTLTVGPSSHGAMVAAFAVF